MSDTTTFRDFPEVFRRTFSNLLIDTVDELLKETHKFHLIYSKGWRRVMKKQCSTLIGVSEFWKAWVRPWRKEELQSIMLIWKLVICQKNQDLRRLGLPQLPVPCLGMTRSWTIEDIPIIMSIWKLSIFKRLRMEIIMEGPPRTRDPPVLSDICKFALWDGTRRWTIEKKREFLNPLPTSLKRELEVFFMMEETYLFATFMTNRQLRITHTL